MKIAFSFSLIFLAAISLFASSVRADEPTTNSSNDAKAVFASFREYNDAMAALDEAKMLAHNHCESEAQKQFSAVQVAGDIAIAKLKAAAQEKFGGDAAVKIGKAVHDISNDEVAAGRVQFQGNRAIVAIGGGGMPMINVDGAWKFDLTVLGSDEQIAEQMKSAQERADKAKMLTDEIKAGNIATLDDAVKAATDRGV